MSDVRGRRSRSSYDARLAGIGGSNTLPTCGRSAPATAPPSRISGPTSRSYRPAWDEPEADQPARRADRHGAARAPRRTARSPAPPSAGESTGGGGAPDAAGEVGRVAVDRRVDGARGDQAHVDAGGVAGLLPQHADQPPQAPLAGDVGARVRRGEGAQQRTAEHQHPVALGPEARAAPAAPPPPRRTVGADHLLEDSRGTSSNRPYAITAAVSTHTSMPPKSATAGAPPAPGSPAGTGRPGPPAPPRPARGTPPRPPPAAARSARRARAGRRPRRTPARRPARCRLTPPVSTTTR